METTSTRRRLVMAAAVVAAASLALSAPAAAEPSHDGRGRSAHVLLVSVDGLHQQDLA
ncbi:hypothetical protein ACPPVO_35375 [Dactylosporangium sp. McL0621]|uniref:hypothetical protein n=1 Tax=Dactylosporangium sp. McL0621 TaxID=3415678 RepID=UPI003CF03192